MGGIITNLVTGITEPLVFPYVFAAPVIRELYENILPYLNNK